MTVTGARVDPRPLSDRSFMQACVRNLICYLSEHHFDQAVSQKTLNNPSAKDFQAIFTFLVRQLDPHFQWSGKFEDEVPQLLKRLRYPFTVSKSALYAVGSPHTWPTLLGCLTWMVELLVYDSETKLVRDREIEAIMREAGMLGSDDLENVPLCDDESVIASQAVADERLFFDYLSATYEAFLAGADEFDAFDNELDAAFENRIKSIQLAVEKLETKMASSQRQLDHLKASADSGHASLASLAQKREDYISDLDKFHKLIAQLESHKAMLDAKHQERQAELEQKKDELTRLSQDVEHLKQVVASQEMNAIDVEQIARKRRELRGALDRARQVHSESEERLP